MPTMPVHGWPSRREIAARGGGRAAARLPPARRAGRRLRHWPARRRAGTVAPRRPAVSDDDTLAATRRLICAYEDALIGVERMPAVAWLHWSDGPVGKHV